jgi:hypothetical protein
MTWTRRRWLGSTFAAATTSVLGLLAPRKALAQLPAPEPAPAPPRKPRSRWIGHY